MAKKETLSQNTHRLIDAHKDDPRREWHVMLTERCRGLECERTKPSHDTKHHPELVREDIAVMSVFWSHRMAFTMRESARGDDFYFLELEDKSQFTSIYVTEHQMRAFMFALRVNGYHGTYQKIGQDKAYEF